MYIYSYCFPIRNTQDEKCSKQTNFIQMLLKNTEVIVLIPSKIMVYKLHSFKWKTNSKKDIKIIVQYLSQTLKQN